MIVITEVLRRVRNAVADTPRRADGNINADDLYAALNDAYNEASEEARLDAAH